VIIQQLDKLQAALTTDEQQRLLRDVREAIFPEDKAETTAAPASPLPDEIMLDMLCGAIEGGSNYWYSIRSAVVDAQIGETYVDKLWKCIQSGNSFTVNDIEDDSKLGIVSRKSLITGTAAMAEKYPDHFKDAVEQTGDAITADVWFQCVVMNEVTYG